MPVMDRYACNGQVCLYSAAGVISMTNITAFSWKCFIVIIVIR